jgi:hypothetical protein
MDTLQAVDSCRPELDLDAAVQPVEAAVRCTCKYKVGTSGTVYHMLDKLTNFLLFELYHQYRIATCHGFGDDAFDIIFLCCRVRCRIKIKNA